MISTTPRRVFFDPSFSLPNHTSARTRHRNSCCTGILVPMDSPSHVFSCDACNETFKEYMSAFDHILLDLRHKEDLDKIQHQVGQFGKWAAINAKITVLLVADDVTSAEIKNAARRIVPGPVSRVSSVHIDSYAHVSPSRSLFSFFSSFLSLRLPLTSASTPTTSSRFSHAKLLRSRRRFRFAQGSFSVNRTNMFLSWTETITTFS